VSGGRIDDEGWVWLDAKLMDRSNRQMELADGRRLGWAEYGAAEGRPVMYFHGWPASRLEPRLLDSDCVGIGVRLIAPDRPGMGLSDFKRGRTISEWPKDVVELAEHLGLEKFVVLGVSGGGPYAAACAQAIPGKLAGAMLVCSMGPVENEKAMLGMAGPSRLLLRLARAAPWAARLLAPVCLKAIWGKGERAMPEALETRLARADQLLLERTELRDSLIASSREAFRHGARGPGWDGYLYSQPWGFKLEETHCRVFLWHGEEDVIVPAAMGRELAARIPGCQARFCPEDGHLSLPFNRFREILAAVSE
jgi:pimeloyl-ACP methyl ester carboxylesterase